MKKKGEFALGNVVGLILVLLAFLALVLLIYFLRDKIKELLNMIMEILRL